MGCLKQASIVPYKIAKDTVGKLIKLVPNKDPEITDWITRRDLTFQESLIDPAVVASKAKATKSVKKPLAVRMAEQGYALFGGDSGGERDAQYVLAVPYSDIEIVVDPKSKMG